MTDYYVNSARANDTGNGLTWAAAKKTFGAVVTAASGAGDRIFIVNTHNEAITTSATYTFAGTLTNPTIVICTSDTANEPPQSKTTGAIVGASAYSAAGVSITLNGKAYIYGVEFDTNSGGGSGGIAASVVDDSHLHLDHCTLKVVNTNGNGSIAFGDNVGNISITTIACTFIFGDQAAQGFALGGGIVWNDYGSTISKTTTALTTLIEAMYRGARVVWEGTNWSDMTGTLCTGASEFAASVVLINCRNGSDALLGTSSGPGHTEIWAYNCATGDTHYSLAHYNYWGNTTVVATPYFTTGGALYDGTNHVTWKVTGTNATEATPYCSPWIDKYQVAATVSPYLEILRNNESTTNAFKDDKVWGEFSYQGSSGYTNSTIVTDRNANWWYTNADQAAGAGLGSWTGEFGNCWSGKLEGGSIVVYELGHLRARVCVAGAYTVYVDPTIRFA